MTTDYKALPLVHDAEQKQFRLLVGHHHAVVDYQWADENTLRLTHTKVPSELGGRGIGTVLVGKVLDYAEKQGYQVIPVCPFIAAFIEKRPHYQQLLAQSEVSKGATESSELTLYAYTFRTRAERVIWTLQELQLPFKLVRLDPMKGETRDAEFLKLHPQAKVPVLVHGDHVLTESLAIMEYANALSDQIQLVPQGAMPEYHYRQMTYYILSEVESYLWIAEQASRLKRFYPWPDGTYEECMQRVNKGLKTVFEQVSGQQYVLEQQFSLADIYAYQIISWAHSQGVEVPDAAVEYMAGLEQRSAFPEAMLWQR